MPWDNLSFTDAAPIIAGAAGGVVRSISLRQNLRESIATVTVGILCSTYLSAPFAPVLVKWGQGLFPTLPDALGPSGFIVGFLGIAFTGFIMDIFRGWTKRFGKAGEP